MTTINPPSPFMNTEKFSLEVERRFERDPKTTLLEHATAVLEEMNIDPADGNVLISKSLKERIRVQSSGLRLLKERNSTISLSL